MAKHGYIVTKEKSEFGLTFVFYSEGVKGVIKIIDYAYTGLVYLGSRTYNLALGDYNPETKTIHDDSNTLNGDVYVVLNTVLNTVPEFFNDFPDCTLMVKGSDSGELYARSCKLTCRKNCLDSDNCKNKNRRINIYTSYVSSNYDMLVKEYIFYGVTDDLTESFQKHKKYDSVFIQKKVFL
jgi:hypothetical protein